ncbi:unnamed protein product [Cylicocyclus nassatus]|uniref:Uncharacterized protein n=1 Tax=Cylicocyclus nassatus TaxID=53992 RepID=A0AA36GHY9_CYLNA|nr:unnamed protein product [Cylicocyclus nassatus]
MGLIGRLTTVDVAELRTSKRERLDDRTVWAPRAEWSELAPEGAGQQKNYTGKWAAAAVFAQWRRLLLEDALILFSNTQERKKKMFANGQNDAARQAAWEVELAARGEAREAVYNAMMNGSSPSWGDLVRSVSLVSPQSFGEHVEDFSPPASGRASVDHTTVFNAATRAELHLTESLERIEELEEELQVARGQIDALQWSRGLRDSQYRKSESLRKEQEKDLTRMVRDLQTVHEVLPRALEAHRAKVRSLHPEEEEELLHHFLRRGNVVETCIEIINHGEGMVRVTTDRDEFFFAPMRSGKKKRFNLFRSDKSWRTDHPWVRLHMGQLRLINYGRTAPLPDHFAKFLLRNLAGISEVRLENVHCDSLKE